MNKLLHRYWFSFVPATDPSMFLKGYGVTAYSVEDALALLAALVHPVFGLRELVETVVDVDIRLIEGNHVRPNMGNPVLRGVWWPPFGAPVDS